MSAIVAKLGLDQSEFKNGLRAAVAEKNKAVRDLTARTGGRSQSNDFRLGQVAMQAQDVAVSLEMGASYSRVIAQQGSQIASIFGTGGMIFGGGLAIAGIFTSMALESQQAFVTMKRGFEDFNASVLQSIKSGGVGELDQKITEIPGKIEELNKKLKGFKNFGTGLLTGMGVMFGGDSVNTQQLAIIKEKLNQEQLLAEAGERRVVVEQQLTEIAKARANGNHEEAEDLERKLKHEQEIAKIQQVHKEDVAKRLVAEKKAQFAAEQIVIDKERQAKMEEDCTKAAEEHAKAIEKQADAESDLAAVQEAKRKRAADMRDERVAAERELRQVGESAAEKEARLLKEFATLQGAAHAAEMMQLPEAEKLRGEAAKKQKEIAEQAIARNEEIGKSEEARAKKAEELHGKLHKLEAKAAQAKSESVKLTLGELASEGRGADGMLARKAAKELERSRKAALRGDVEGAQTHRDKAEEIKKKIGSLKDSEKGIGDEFGDALERSQILKDIEKNTAGSGKVKP